MEVTLRSKDFKDEIKRKEKKRKEDWESAYIRQKGENYGKKSLDMLYIRR